MNRIRELRKSRNMTMKELGAAFCVAESTISLYETGKRSIDQDLILRFAEFFNVSVDYLLGKETRTNESANSATEDDIKVALFHGAEEVTDEMWDEVKRFAAYVQQKHEDDKKD